MMENKSPAATDTEQLLRQAALFSEYDERETVLEMTANFILNEKPATSPYQTRSIPKFYLNIFLAGLTALGLSLFFLLRGSDPALPHHQPATKHVPPSSGPEQSPGTDPKTPAGAGSTGLTTKQSDSGTSSETGSPAPRDSSRLHSEAKNNDFYIARSNGAGRIPVPVHTKYPAWPEIPEISEAEISANEKRKADMVKTILKQDKKSWPDMRSGTDAYTLLISATEVSNLEYRTFLYDLVIQNRLDEFRAAAVIDSMWTITRTFNEPFREYYSRHPAFNNYPVVNLHYESMLAYCRWLSDLVNEVAAARPRNNNSYKLRLPTEKEWIAAALGDQSEGPYPWSGPYVRNSKGAFLANFQAFRDTFANGQIMLPYEASGTTAPVTTYFPNDLGLYCISGNVAEAVLAETGSDSIITKGGSWKHPAWYLQVKSRLPVHKDSTAQNFIGFRPLVEIRPR